VNSDQEIEDDETCKPLHTKKIERFELKAGRHHPFRMDRVRVLTYEEESVELSSGILQESLHIGTLLDPNTLRTQDDDICNQRSPSAIFKSQREDRLTSPILLSEGTPRLPGGNSHAAAATAELRTAKLEEVRSMLKKIN
jgi:hypothetical protein